MPEEYLYSEKQEMKVAYLLDERIDEVSLETKTLVGGTQAFDTPEIFLRNGIDYIVRGEGEIQRSN